MITWELDKGPQKTKEKGLKIKQDKEKKLQGEVLTSNAELLHHSALTSAVDCVQTWTVFLQHQVEESHIRTQSSTFFYRKK